MCSGQNIANWRHPLHPLKARALRGSVLLEELRGERSGADSPSAAGKDFDNYCALVTSAVVTLLRGGHWASSARFCAEKVTCIVLVPTTPWGGGEIVPILRMRKLRLDEVDGLGSRSE